MIVQKEDHFGKKKLLISVINYGNENEVIAFAKHLSNQSVADSILLTVTSNKWSENGRDILEQGLQAVKLDMLVLDPCDNLGYLNGTLLGYNTLRAREDFAPRWIAISNTDIEFCSDTFFEKLLQTEWPDDVGCIAPNVYVPSTGAYENPRYLYRFTDRSLEKRIKYFSSPLIAGIQQRLGAIKAGISRGCERDSQYAYLAHGCCFFISPELAGAMCDTPYGTLLYSEEAYVAEMGIRLGKRVYYDRSLKLRHNENAVTGKLRNSQRAKMYADSLNLILRQFYSDASLQSPYSEKDVCAVIVSYNDPSHIDRNAQQLCEDGVHLVVVDNGSAPRVLDELKNLQCKFGFSLICNNENMGIAAALQQGLSYACDHHFGLLLTLDQDSILCAGAVHEMIRVINDNGTIASVGPEYSSEYRSAEEKEYQFVDYLISSGNLVKTNVAVCIGGFDCDMFIDSVDFDFSLKLRRNGYRIAMAKGAHLQHQIGDQYSPGGWLSFVHCELHSPLRYYYMLRNHKILCTRYKKAFPLFCLKKNVAMMLEKCKVNLLFPERKRYRAAMRKGIADAKSGRMGRCTDSF